MATKTTRSKIVTSFCARHGRMLNINDFYKSRNPNHENKVFPYCKECMRDISKKLIKKYGSIEAGIYFTCAEVGIPFTKKAYEVFEQKLNNKQNINNYFGLYLQSLYPYATDAEKEKWTDFGASDVDLKDIKAIVPSSKNIDLERKELELVWGKKFDSEQLAYLEYRFNSYTEGKELKEYEEMTYRNLCKAELDIYLDIDIDNAIKRQIQCAKILHLDSFEVEKERTQIERIIESDIFMMEKEEPAEYYKDKELYQDFRGIGRGWLLEILRPLKNLIVGSKEYPVDNGDLENFDKKVAEALEKESHYDAGC